MKHTNTTEEKPKQTNEEFIHKLYLLHVLHVLKLQVQSYIYLN